MQKIKARLALFRVSNLPTVFSNVLAGAALAGLSRFDALFWQMGLLGAFAYTAGMALNDFFDYRFDRVHNPQRPLPSGLIGPREALAWGLAFCAGACLLAAGQGIPTLGATLLLLAFVWIYDFWHKKAAFSRLFMGLCRAMLYVVAFVAYGLSDGLGALLWPALALLAYVTGLTLAAWQAGRPFSRPARLGTVFCCLLPYP